MHEARHDVDELAAGGGAVAQRLLDVGIEVLLAAGQRAAPALALGAPSPAVVLNSASVRPLALRRAAMSPAEAS